jgi:prepilin-type N-terminal cleavage/methylation domain-containing protein
MEQRPRIRDGFTLAELVVSILIIALLVGLAVAAAGRYIAVSQATVTGVTIRQVYGRLHAQRATVIKAAESEDMLKSVGPTVLSQIQTAAGYSPSSPIQDWAARARVIYVKLRLRQEFPMTFAEALNPAPLPPKQAYAEAFSGLTAGHTYESAACLLRAVTRGQGGRAISADTFGTGSVKTFVDPSTGANIPALVDGWGTPLAFYRWPWGSSEVDSLAPAIQPGQNGSAATPNGSVVRDPEDPLGLLMNMNWYATAGRSTFEGWCHAVTNNNVTGGQAPQYAYYMVPVLVSAGPNSQLGLTSQTKTTAPPYSPGPMDPDGSNNDSDNIYSFRLLPPGTGGN